MNEPRAQQTDVSQSDALGFKAHLAFFDLDNDQRITPRETQQGLSRIGLGHFISLPATVVIHAGVAGLGMVRGMPQNPLSLAIDKVGVLRHPDTALVDEAAQPDVGRVHETFSAYGREYAGDALTFAEIAHLASQRLTQGAHSVVDYLLLPGGAAGTAIEWGALLWLAGELRDGKRVLTKRAALRFYTDASFFSDVARRLERVRARRARTLLGRIRNYAQTWLL